MRLTQRQMGWLGDLQTQRLLRRARTRLRRCLSTLRLSARRKRSGSENRTATTTTTSPFAMATGLRPTHVALTLIASACIAGRGPARPTCSPRLRIGRHYEDPSNGFSVAHENHTATLAMARISVATSCGATAPSLTLTPRNQSGAAGIGVSYERRAHQQRRSHLQRRGICALSSRSFGLGELASTGYAHANSWSNRACPFDADGSAGHSLRFSNHQRGGDRCQRCGTQRVDDRVVHRGPDVLEPACSQLHPGESERAAGSETSLHLSLVNRDDAGCPAASVSVVPSVPASWTAAASPSAVSLAPRRKRRCHYDVTSVHSELGPHPSGNVAESAGGMQLPQRAVMLSTPAILRRHLVRRGSSECSGADR